MYEASVPLLLKLSSEKSLVKYANPIFWKAEEQTWQQLISCEPYHFHCITQ